ncbi:MAG: SPOR domain-containing protein [Thermodesulfobacteriota bacterium]
MPKALRRIFFSVLVTVIACLIVPAGIPAATAGNEPSLSFTVQLGSYKSLENAKQVFHEYLASFPRHAPRLRIESFSRYFVLRVGCFADHESARNLKQKTVRLFPDAYILQAYYIQDRILREKTGTQTSAREDAFYAPDKIYTRGKTIADGSVVPESEHISDTRARVMLARLFLRQGGQDNWKKAGLLLKQLQRTRANDPEVDILRIRLEAARGKRTKVAELTDNFLRKQAFDPAVLMEIADISASLGHFARCRDIYQLVLSKLQGAEKETAELTYAERALSWGNFYAGERIIRKALRSGAHEPELILRLAENLLAQQRFTRARKYIQMIVRDLPQDSNMVIQAGILRINTGIEEKDFARAAKDTDEYISIYGNTEDILIPGGRAYYLAGRIKDSEELYHRALTKDKLKADALIGLARIRFNQGEKDEAKRYLAAVGQDSSKYPLARVLYYKDNESDLAEFVAGFTRRENDPGRLLQLAQALADEGYFEAAIRCCQAGLELDDAYFPARMGLAEFLAASGEYARSLDVLQSMQSIFPDSYKIALTRARVLGWSRQYRDSLAAYKEIQPANTVALREAARTAYWGKMAEKGDELYARIYTLKVDSMLLDRVSAFNNSRKGQIPARIVRKLKERLANGSVFQGYEDFFAWYNRNKSDLDKQVADRIQEIKFELKNLYITQKRAFLERKAKKLAWNRRFAPARRALTRLSACDPGNQEALFDLAQMDCALGLCDEENSVYKKLLDLDPLHAQAKKALERQEVRSRPLVFADYDFWKEKGRGDLSRMTRHRLDLGAEIPVACRHNLNLIAHRYFENPQKYGDMVQASGISLGGEIVTGPYISLSGQITHKAYDSDLQVRNFSDLAGGDGKRDSFATGLKDITLGYLNLRANMDNYAALTVGYEKREEVVNAMALAQGIYSERLKARLDMHPVRKLDMALEAEHLDYSDNNSGYVYGGEIGYALTDHPRLFKIIFSERFRDTSREYQACSDSAGQCSIKDDFKHPYWTPQDYWGADITFEFRHDLAEDFFCGAREHFYDLRLTLGTEQDSNNYVQLRGLWKKEFADRIGVKAEAMWHDSREWKAAAGQLGIFYRF